MACKSNDFEKCRKWIDEHKPTCTVCGQRVYVYDKIQFSVNKKRFVVAHSACLCKSNMK